MLFYILPNHVYRGWRSLSIFPSSYIGYIDRYGVAPQPSAIAPYQVGSWANSAVTQSASPHLVVVIQEGSASASDPPVFMAGPSTGTRILSDRYTMQGLGAYDKDPTKCSSHLQDENVRDQPVGMNFAIFATFLCLLSLVASQDAQYASSSLLTSQDCLQDMPQRLEKRASPVRKISTPPPFTR